VITRPELEKWLADRVRFHNVPANREALKAALKTYLNKGVPVVEDESAGAGDGGGWVETVDEA
jgi:hypothetical protein